MYSKLLNRLHVYTMRKEVPHLALILCGEKGKNTKHGPINMTRKSTNLHTMSFVTCGLGFHLSSFCVQVLCSNLPHVSPHWQTLHPRCCIAHTSRRRTPTIWPTVPPVFVQATHSAKTNKNYPCILWQASLICCKQVKSSKVHGVNCLNFASGRSRRITVMNTLLPVSIVLIAPFLHACATLCNRILFLKITTSTSMIHHSFCPFIHFIAI